MTHSIDLSHEFGSVASLPPSCFFSIIIFGQKILKSPCAVPVLTNSSIPKSTGARPMDVAAGDRLLRATTVLVTVLTTGSSQPSWKRSLSPSCSCASRRARRAGGRSSSSTKKLSRSHASPKNTDHGRRRLHMIRELLLCTCLLHSTCSVYFTLILGHVKFLIGLINSLPRSSLRAKDSV